MKILKIPLSLFVILLGGCQSLGEHYNCMAEVDRLVPAQTQQRYVRTDTKCVKSNEQTFQVTGGYSSKVYNPGQGDVNCSSVPIYETVVLNQSQRDDAYRQCRNNINNMNNQQSYSAPAATQKTPEEIRKYDAQRSKCDPIKDNDKFLACMRGGGNGLELKSKYSANSPFCREIADKNSPEYKTNCEQLPSKNPQQLKPVGAALIPFSATTSMEKAKQKCFDLGFKVGTESFGQCVLRLSK